MLFSSVHRERLKIRLIQKLAYEQPVVSQHSKRAFWKCDTAFYRLLRSSGLYVICVEREVTELFSSTQKSFAQVSHETYSTKTHFQKKIYSFSI